MNVSDATDLGDRIPDDAHGLMSDWLRTDRINEVNVAEQYGR
jgi:hypothetical protein